MSMWTTWPSREALDREGRSAGRQVVGRGIRAILLGGAVWATTTRNDLPGWQTALALLGLAAAAGAVWLFFRLTLRHLLWPSLAVVLALLGGAVACQALGATVAASVLM